MAENAQNAKLQGMASIQADAAELVTLANRYTIKLID